MVSGQRNPGVLLETRNSLTPPDQVRVLLHAVEGGTSQSREALNQIFSNLEPAFEAEQIHQNNMMMDSEQLLDETQPSTATESKLENMDEQKQRMTEIITDIKNLLKDAEVQSKEKLTDGTSTFDLLEIQLCQIQENMENTFNELKEYSIQVQSEKSQIETIKIRMQADRLDIERNRKLIDTEMDALKSTRKSIEDEMKELDNKLQRVKREIKEMEVVSREVQMKKKELEKMIRSNRKSKEDTSIKTDEARKTVQDTEESPPQWLYVCDQCKSKQMKWVNFQAKKKRQELDCRLEKTIRQRDELEIMKIQIQQQKQEVKRQKQDVMTSVLTMAKVKANMENAYEEIRNLMEDVFRIKSSTADYSRELKKYQETLACMKDRVNSWKMRTSSVGKIFLGNTFEHEEHQEEAKPNIKTGAQEDTSEEKTLILLQPSVMVEDRDKVKESSEHQHTPMETQIQDQTLPDKDEAQFLMDSSQKVDLDIQMSEPKGRDAAVQRLELEIHRTIEVIKTFLLEIGYQVTETNPNELFKNVDCETERVLDNVKQFQELLQMVETAIEQSKMCLKKDTKSMKFAVEKRRRELDHKLEQILRQRDELEILKIKVQRESIETEKNLEKMTSCWSSMTEMITKSREKNEEIKIRMEKTEIKLRLLNESSTATEATQQQRMERIYLLKTKCMAELETIRTKIKKLKESNSEKEMRDERKNVRVGTDTETDDQASKAKSKQMENAEDQIITLTSQKLVSVLKLTESLDPETTNNVWSRKSTSNIQKTPREEFQRCTQVQAEPIDGKVSMELFAEEFHKMNKQIEDKKQELNGHFQQIRREIQEMEILKSELQIKRKENEHVLRKLMRQREQNEIMLNKIKQEKISLRRETRKKKRELDQRLEKTIRERDALEVFHLKMNRLKEELVIQQLYVKDKTADLHADSGDQKQDSEKTDKKSIQKGIREEQLNTDIASFIKNLQRMKEKIQDHLVKITGDKNTLENLKMCLDQQKDGLKTFQGETLRLSDEVIRVKTQIKTASNKIIPEKGEKSDEIINKENDLQKQELDVALEKVKRERQELEVLMTDLDIKKKENQRIVRKNIQKEQDVERMWNAVREEKDTLKRQTQRRKKELDLRLERIIRERDELEVMKIRFNKEKEVFTGGMIKLGLTGVSQAPGEIQKHWTLLQMCTKTCVNMKTYCEGLIQIIKGVKQQIIVHADMIKNSREESSKIRLEMERQKEKIQCSVKRIQEEQKFLKQNESTRKDQSNVKTEKKMTKKSKRVPKKPSKTEISTELDKSETTNVKTDKQEQESNVMRQTKERSVGDEEETAVVKRKGKKTKKTELLLKNEALDLFFGKESANTRLIPKEETFIGERTRFYDPREKIFSSELPLVAESKCEEFTSTLTHELESEDENTMDDISVDTTLELKDKKEKEQWKKHLKVRDSAQEHELQNQRLDKVLNMVKKTIFEDIKQKMAELENKMEKTDKLSIELEENFKSFEELKQNLTHDSEIFQRQKEALKSALSDVTKQRAGVETEQRKMIDMERQEVEKHREELTQERQDLDRAINTMKEEKLDLELMKSESQKLGEVMKQAEKDLKTKKDKMDDANVELQKKTEAVNSLMEEMHRERLGLQQLMVHVDSQRKRLDDVLDSVVTQQSERDSNEKEFQKQAEELEIRLKQVQAEREELNAQNDSCNKMKEEVEAAMMDQLREKEKVNQMRVDVENERERIQAEKNRLEIEQSELNAREEQLLDRMKSFESRETKLQELSKTNVEALKQKMEELENKMEKTDKLSIELEENFKSFEELKQNLTHDSEIFQRQKEALKRKSRGREKLNDLNDSSNSIKDNVEAAMIVDIEIERASSQSLFDVIKQTDGMETEKIIMIDMDRPEADKLRQAMSHDRQDLDSAMKGQDFEYFDFTEPTESSFKGQFQESKLRNFYGSLVLLMKKLKHFNAIAFDLISKNFDQLIQNNRQNFDILSHFERTINVEKYKYIIDAIHKFMKNENQFSATLRSEKAVQTESEELSIKSQKLQNLPPDILPPEIEDLPKSKEDQFSLKVKDEDHVNEEKRDHLRKIWKDTRIDQKEIRQMKSRGQEIRHNLEKRLKLVNQFVKRTVLQKENTIVEDSMSVQNQSTESLTQSDGDRSSEKLNSKYLELHHLKATVLKEIKNVHAKGTAPNTCEKGNQTVQVDIMSVSEQNTGGEEGTHAETSKGLLCQLRHYCSRCCCLCCACQKRMCPNEK
ncbi:trichohyalin isoform X2 [Oryzias melastigma]|nr:trichohyalin isoform X2 [Oryzias melastigma]